MIEPIFKGWISPHSTSPVIANVWSSNTFQDSAEWYENEKETGQAILDFCQLSGIPRSEIFYTTKLKFNNGYDHVRRAIAKSLEDCALGYIDLYLIHGPIGGPEARRESWRAICDAQKEGVLKSIGISTYGIRHMEEMLDTGLPLPVIHQVRLPFLPSVDPNTNAV